MALIIKRAKFLGFCEGVKRAIDLTEQALSNQSLKKQKSNITVVGELIHNKQVVSELQNRGLQIVSSVEEVKPGSTLIVRSHGMPKAHIDKAKKKGIEIIDATCVKVKRLHNITRILVEQGYDVVLVGDHNHAEVEAIVESVQDNITVVSTPEELKDKKFSKKIGVIAQTTQSEQNFIDVVTNLLKISREMKIYNTICNASILRQNAAASLSREVDLMVVIGGKHSANTNRLAEICRKNVETIHIETGDEILPENIKGKKSIGITAGASTPSWIVDKVEEKIRKLSGSHNPSKKVKNTL
ncbi:MAG: 4-hydroxy-3-methylbut-2-enyl diphosphate reductase [Candidatus Schekmanbacteria bacterium]|nr:4-hydroxy-3-methylbut-2-enyl diphosphate reductase [Candidatus Schekmanbacteria bacterium]